ncbi:hypothetical protein GCM10010289_62570 [Streptomyces violascens]|uniref:Uncharacterized protein n=1 Tax=Streptomyces violascens TaxID=67381 RepID=A0ABQ3QSF5_9ACTN|nr:hypothetical protein GCM10010289_62570 [Streptomyces violascens]GHI40198.1 hypothetical protein Sviol_46060 [Streptomyces violascens]
MSEAELGEDAGTGAGEIPSQSLPRLAAMALAGAGADFLTQLLDDPERAIDRRRALAAIGEFGDGCAFRRGSKVAGGSGVGLLGPPRLVPGGQRISNTSKYGRS